MHRDYTKHEYLGDLPRRNFLLGIMGMEEWCATFILKSPPFRLIRYKEYLIVFRYPLRVDKPDQKHRFNLLCK